MKVLFLTHNFPREPGDNAGAFVLHLALALRNQGIEVRVVAPADPNVEDVTRIEGVTVEHFRYAPRRYENLAYTGNMATLVAESWSAKLAMLGFLGAEFGHAVRTRREFEPDVVHAHWWFPGGLVGSWVSALSHRPLVTTLHGSDVRLARGTAMARPLFRHVLRQSRAVTAVSHWLAREAESLVSGVQASVAPMPVAVELFSPGSNGPRDRLLFVGRLSEQKGIALLLEALAAMRQPASLDVIGDGPATSALQARATALGLGDRIAWHGRLAQPALVPFYQHARALVVPSIEEGLGLVAVEAQLCQTPVVAFDSGGLTDTVRDGLTGHLVPPGDVAALAAALDDVMLHPERAGEMGTAGRMVALAGFAPETAARRYAGVYKSVLAAATSSHNS
jgi:glycosyltransferase involved in cell wall biosynthesis